MHKKVNYQLKVLMFTGVVLGSAYHVHAQQNALAVGQRGHLVHNSNAVYATSPQVVVGNGYSASCPCPHCSARKAKQHGLHDFVHGFQSIPLVQWMIDDNYYTRSPDHGFARITKRPVQRTNIVYTRYWPTHWYGTSQHGVPHPFQRYPSVGLPTDTTQLGYYYQHVPQWQPRAGMIPPRPNPEMFHTLEVCNGICSGVNCVYCNIPTDGKIIEPSKQNNVPPAPTANNGLVPVPQLAESK